MTTAVISNQLPALSSGSLNGYLDSIQQISLLTAKEEVGLFLRFQEYNDVEAARKIVLSHLRYVAYVARSYMGYGLPLEDLIQQGNVGLMKSVKKFNLDHKVRLVSFAVHWIKAEIHEFILKNWKIVKIATTKAQRKLFFNLRRKKKRLGWFSDAEVKAVAEDLGVSTKDVLQMEARLTYQDNTFDAPDTEDEEKAIPSPSSYIESKEIQPEQALIEQDSSSRHSKNLRNAMATLDDRSKDIVTKRWLSDEKTTLQQLANEYSVSAERIRQLENNAMKKLKHVMVA